MQCEVCREPALRLLGQVSRGAKAPTPETQVSCAQARNALFRYFEQGREPTQPELDHLNACGTAASTSWAPPAAPATTRWRTTPRRWGRGIAPPSTRDPQAPTGACSLRRGSESHEALSGENSEVRPLTSNLQPSRCHRTRRVVFWMLPLKAAREDERRSVQRPAGKINLVAVQARPELADYASAHAFHTKMAALAQRAVAAVDRRHPTLLAFPEAIGLFLSFVPFHYDDVKDCRTLRQALLKVLVPPAALLPGRDVAAQDAQPAPGRLPRHRPGRREDLLGHLRQPGPRARRLPAGGQPLHAAHRGGGGQGAPPPEHQRLQHQLSLLAAGRHPAAHPQGEPGGAHGDGGRLRASAEERALPGGHGPGAGRRADLLRRLPPHAGRALRRPGHRYPRASPRTTTTAGTGPGRPAAA